MPTDLEGDPQDQSEVFDEDNQSPDGVSAEYRTFEEMPDVIDLTQAVGDADDDDALIAEELDDDEIIELEADADMADIEDDALAARTAEPDDVDEEVYLAEEDRYDTADNGAGEDEAPLEFMGRLDGAPDVESREAPAAEAEALDDDDLNDLGYR